MTWVLAVSREDIADYVNTLALVYLVLIFIRIIMSWIPRIPYNRFLSAFISFVTDVTDPYLNLFRRFIPPVRMGPGALDLSPIVATFVLIIVSSVVAGIERGDQVNVFFALDFTNTRNTGVAFGAFEGGGLIVALLIGISLALLLVYFVLHADTPWLWLPVGMLLGGALGNLADRAREGAVIDFIDPIAWPAFNVADSCIVIGVLALLYVIEGRPGRPR
jgi:lipoprotein signal peptidase